MEESQGWSSQLESLLRTWGKQVSKNVKVHSILSRRYRRRYILLGAPAAILGSIASSSGFVTLRGCGDVSENTCMWIKFSIYILMFISSGLSGILAFLNYGGVSKEHSMAAERFSALFRIIDNILILSRDKRGIAVDILNSIRSQYDVIINSSPSLKSIYEEDELTFTVKGKSDVEIDINSTRNYNTDIEMSELMNTIIHNERNNINNPLKYQLSRLEG